MKTLLAPLRDFEANWSDRVPNQDEADEAEVAVAAEAGSKGVKKGSWKAQVLTVVVERYRSTVLDLLATVQQMEKTLKKRGKQKKDGAGGAGGGGHNISDAEKIGLQLYLDTEALGAELEEHGVARDGLESYRSLLAEVQVFKSFQQP